MTGATDNDANAAATVPWRQLYLSDDYLTDFAALFDDRFQSDLLRIMGDRADGGAVRRGLAAAVRAYLTGQRDAERGKPSKLETRRLEPVANAAHDLVEALHGLTGKGNAEAKLVHALAVELDGQDDRGARLLRALDATTGPGDSLRALREALAHVERAAAATVGKAPGGSSDDFRERDARITRAELAAWEQGETRPAKDGPLQELIEAFRAVWEANSDHPYVPGMHHKETGGTKSKAVDALALIVARLDPALPRSRLATVLKNLNAARRAKPE